LAIRRVDTDDRSNDPDQL